MRIVGNILWFALAGLWLAIGYMLAGISSCVLIVTIPVGIHPSSWPASTPGTYEVPPSLG